MIGKDISHYRISEKLGEGGMGVVYKAEDTRLNRTVALKFLPPEFTRDSEANVRFVQEAQAASALDHPNICNIHEIDKSADGRMFICMAYYKGETLKTRIQRSPLNLEEAIGIAVQVAEGLQEAHEKGIVHRDIKSANIMLTTKGQVKIMDFGLAKLAGLTQVTKSGTTLGTIAYMSPEQAGGEAVDHRSDIWSLGVVLYEMVTGRRPFKGDYEQAVIYSILHREPQQMTELCTGIPLELDRIVRKALAKSPDERYQHARDILVDLKSLGAQLESGSLKEHVAAKKSIPSIAVLPFRDMSPQRDQEYFCEGMAEELINALVKIERVSVAARTSAFQFKGKDQDIRKIGEQLGVSTVLEGSVRKAGNRLRITAQLINVADGYHLWSDKYDRDMEDIFSIQEEIAQHIVQALRVKLSDKEKHVLEKAPTKDVQAYDLYLRGRKFFYQTRRRSIELAREMFLHAIEKDRGYSLAYAGIADCCSWFFMYWDRDKVNLEQAIAAGEKALELDPELAEAHAAYALAVSLSERHDEAETEFETAIRLNPKLFEAHYFYARSCFVQGKLQKAAQLFEQACLVNPEDYQAPLLLGNTYSGLKLVAQAKVAYGRGLEIAERHLELNPDDARAIYLGALGLVELGHQEKGLEWASRALSIDPEDPIILYNVACVYSLSGKVEEAINYFERALENGYAHRDWIENDVYLDSIRSHNRFQPLLKKLE
jgi:serine/threonine protein kinase/Flp pilus assembly protein TadD